MKPPERVLREWTLNRIRFHAGEPRYQHWTRNGIATIAKAINTGESPTKIETVQKHGSMWEMSYTGTLRSLRVQEVYTFLKKLGKLGVITPIVLAKYDSLRELHREVVHEAVCKGFTIEYWEKWPSKGPPDDR